MADRHHQQQRLTHFPEELSKEKRQQVLQTLRTWLGLDYEGHLRRLSDRLRQQILRPYEIPALPEPTSTSDLGLLCIPDEEFALRPTVFRECAHVTPSSLALYKRMAKEAKLLTVEAAYRKIEESFKRDEEQKAREKLRHFDFPVVLTSAAEMAIRKRPLGRLAWSATKHLFPDTTAKLQVGPTPAYKEAEDELLRPEEIFGASAKLIISPEEMLRFKTILQQIRKSTLDVSWDFLTDDPPDAPTRELFRPPTPPDLPRSAICSRDGHQQTMDCMLEMMAPETQARLFKATRQLRSAAVDFDEVSGNAEQGYFEEPLSIDPAHTRSKYAAFFLDSDKEVLELVGDDDSTRQLRSDSGQQPFSNCPAAEIRAYALESALVDPPVFPRAEELPRRADTTSTIAELAQSQRPEGKTSAPDESGLPTMPVSALAQSLHDMVFDEELESQTHVLLPKAKVTPIIQTDPIWAAASLVNLGFLVRPHDTPPSLRPLGGLKSLNIELPSTWWNAHDDESADSRDPTREQLDVSLNAQTLLTAIENIEADWATLRRACAREVLGNGTSPAAFGTMPMLLDDDDEDDKYANEAQRSPQVKSSIAETPLAKTPPTSSPTCEPQRPTTSLKARADAAEAFTRPVSAGYRPRREEEHTQAQRAQFSSSVSRRFRDVRPSQKTRSGRPPSRGFPRTHEDFWTDQPSFHARTNQEVPQDRAPATADGLTLLRPSLALVETERFSSPPPEVFHSRGADTSSDRRPSTKSHEARDNSEPNRQEDASTLFGRPAGASGQFKRPPSALPNESGLLSAVKRAKNRIGMPELREARLRPHSSSSRPKPPMLGQRKPPPAIELRAVDEVSREPSSRPRPHQAHWYIALVRGLQSYQVMQHLASQCNVSLIEMEGQDCDLILDATSAVILFKLYFLSAAMSGLGSGSSPGTSAERLAPTDAVSVDLPAMLLNPKFDRFLVVLEAYTSLGNPVEVTPQIQSALDSLDAFVKSQRLLSSSQCKGGKMVTVELSDSPLASAWKVREYGDRLAAMAARDAEAAVDAMRGGADAAEGGSAVRPITPLQIWKLRPACLDLPERFESQRRQLEEEGGLNAFAATVVLAARGCLDVFRADDPQRRKHEFGLALGPARINRLNAKWTRERQVRESQG